MNLHTEGTGALPSIVSAWRAVQLAQSRGLTCELLLLLDQPDKPTVHIAERFCERRDVRLAIVSESDLGSARNRACESSTAEWIAFLDGDDLWGEEWLWRAHLAAQDVDAEPVAWHPELNIIFGDHRSIVHHVDSDDPTFSWSRFRLHNQWTALAFVRRNDLLGLPYPRNDLAAGFGFEDWSWNEEVLRRGGKHCVVPQTCHFIKRTSGPSLLRSSQRSLRTRYMDDADITHVARPPEELLSEDSQDATHEVSPVNLSASIEQQLRLALCIEPSIGATLRPGASSIELPQNFQRHTTPAHLALNEIEHLRRLDSNSTATIAELVVQSTRLPKLDTSSRALVMAEVLLDPEAAHCRLGISPMIEDTLAYLPQLEPLIQGRR